MKIKKKCKRCGRIICIKSDNWLDEIVKALTVMPLCEDCMTEEELDDIVSDIRKEYDEIKKTVGDDDDY